MHSSVLLLVILLGLAGCSYHLPIRISEQVAAPALRSNLKPIVTKSVREGLSPLYALRVNERHPRGQDMVMSVRELQRASCTSTVRFHYQSGASVGSAMTLVFALYRIALDREAKFFVMLQEKETPEHDSEFVVGYSNQKHLFPGMYFGMKPNKDIHWFSVEELSKMVGWK